MYTQVIKLPLLKFDLVLNVKSGSQFYLLMTGEYLQGTSVPPAEVLIQI